MTVDRHNLSVEEIQLSRLLSKCEKSTTVESLSNIQERYKFQANIEYMYELLQAIEKETSKNTEQSMLSTFLQRIQALEALIDDEKLLSPVDKSLSKVRQMRFWEKDKLAQLEKEIRMQRKVEDERRKELLFSPTVQEQQNHQDGRNSSFASNTSLQSPDPLRRNSSTSDLRQRRSNQFSSVTASSQSAQETLKIQEQLQDQLTDDLVMMAQALKSHSLAFKDMLKKDEKILSDAYSTLHSNLDRTTSTTSRLKKFMGKSSKTTFLIWILLLLACIIFVAMFFVIRLFPKH
ncbi:vesicle transport protein [Paraphysoderma sedebokerense]|nr:vesicle transport protein [Paraphysoderma sedebokerense]